MNKKKNKILKGDFGYFAYEKKKRLLTTLILFAIPLIALIAGVVVTGKKENIVTVIAVVGCLPACKSLVSCIMMMMQKSMDKEIYEKINPHTEGLVVSYEMLLTTYEKNAYVDSFAICGNKVIGYSSRLNCSPQFVEQHVRKILKQNGYKTEVKVVKELNAYVERLDYMRAHKDELQRDIVFEPDPRYPGYSREDMIKHVILAISL